MAELLLERNLGNLKLSNFKNLIEGLEDTVGEISQKVEQINREVENVRVMRSVSH